MKILSVEDMRSLLYTSKSEKTWEKALKFYQKIKMDIRKEMLIER